MNVGRNMKYEFFCEVWSYMKTKIFFHKDNITRMRQFKNLSYTEQIYQCKTKLNLTRVEVKWKFSPEPFPKLNITKNISYIIIYLILLGYWQPFFQ